MPIIVTVLDTAGIQPYIFGSNVLRENIGGSELVHRATRLWAFEALCDQLKAEGIGDNHNVDLDAARQDDVVAMYTGQFQIDGTDRAGAEVLYAGGGNTVILFQATDPLKLAQAFVYRLSLRLLTDAPGLNLYAAHKSYEWQTTEEGESLPEIVTATIKELGGNKGRDPGSLPALGWPVTAACTSTGLPANDRHPDKKGKTGSASRANRQVAAKWQAADLADKRLKGMFPWIEEARLEWTDNFDELADLPERDDSYIAVVHADGNGMGRYIKELTTHWSNNRQDPRGYISAMRALSSQVQSTAQTALRETLRSLTTHLARQDWKEARQHPVKDGEHYFPVRPIVFGGDDVTLVCAGPWGLAVAQRYLAELERGEKLPGDADDDNTPYACAGVAIVKTHYPFSQAYGLSEQLTKAAKKRARALANKKASALDWHLTTTGLHGDLETIRRREYDVVAGCLTMRPLMLNAGPQERQTWRNWDNLTGLLKIFGQNGSWQEQRNKTMRLREALRRGPEAVAEFLAIFEEDEKDIIRRAGFQPAEAPDRGWVADGEDCLDQSNNVRPRCAYFDAIEIADHCFELPS